MRGDKTMQRTVYAYARGRAAQRQLERKQATAARERYVAVIIRPLVTKGTIASGMSKKIISWLVAAELKWKCAKIILQETICLSVAGTVRQEDTHYTHT